MKPLPWGVLALTLLFPALLPAQSSDYVLSVSSATGETGELVSVFVELDTMGTDISAWSFGVCHPAGLAVLESVVDGFTTLTVNNGEPPEFNAVTLYDGGFTVAAVICLTGCDVLAPGNDYGLNEADYTLTGLAPVSVPLDFCEALGTPPVTTAVVVGGVSVEPQTFSGSLEITGPLPLLYTLSAGDALSFYDPADGEAAFPISVLLEEEAANPGFPNGLTGFNLSLEHDPLFLVGVSVAPGPALAAVNGGAGPDFFAPVVRAGLVGVAVVVSFGATDVLLAEDPSEILIVSYETNPLPFISNLVGVTVPLDWVDAALGVEPGSPPVGITLQSGSAQLAPREKFVRGDANDDGVLGIADGLAVLNFLFTSGTLSCLDAADVNDDGQPGLGDAVLLLGFLFASGDDPAPPFPDCGMDFTGPGNCQIYNSCP